MAVIWCKTIFIMVRPTGFIDSDHSTAAATAAAAAAAEAATAAIVVVVVVVVEEAEGRIRTGSVVQSN